MANKTEYDYTDIEQPYNDDLQRSDDSLSSEVKASTEDSGSSTIESPSDVGGNVLSGSQLSNVWLKTWMKSRNYKPKTQGFIIDGAKGYIECMKLYVGTGGIIGGSLDIPDTISANSWHVDSLGNMWSGAADLASAPFKALKTGAVTCSKITIIGTSTVGGILATTLGGAFNDDGDLINDIVNARINTDSQKILKDFGFGDTDYAGAVKAGSIRWYASSGDYIDGAGVVVYRNGILGADGSHVTFSINTEGNAIFRGNITALTGTIGSFNIGTYLYTGLKVAYNDANVGVHVGGDGISVNSGGTNVFSVNGSTGALTATSATISGSITATSGSIAGSLVTSGINASNISTGTLNASVVTVSNINASNITTGTLSANRIASTSIGASKLDSTVISGGKIITGLLTASNINTGTLSGVNIQSSSGNNRIVLSNGDYLRFYTGGTLRASVRGVYGSSSYTGIVCDADMVVNNNRSFWIKSYAGTAGQEGGISITSGNEFWLTLGTNNTFYLKNNAQTVNYLTASSSRVYIGSDYLLLKTLSSNPTTEAGGIWHFMNGLHQFRGEPSPGWIGRFEMTLIV